MSTTGALIAVATECGGAAASLNEYKSPMRVSSCSGSGKAVRAGVVIGDSAPGDCIVPFAVPGIDQ